MFYISSNLLGFLWLHIFVWMVVLFPQFLNFDIICLLYTILKFVQVSTTGCTRWTSGSRPGSSTRTYSSTLATLGVEEPRQLKKKIRKLGGKKVPNNCKVSEREAEISVTFFQLTWSLETTWDFNQKKTKYSAIKSS